MGKNYSVKEHKRIIAEKFDKAKDLESIGSKEFIEIDRNRIAKLICDISRLYTKSYIVSSEFLKKIKNTEDRIISINEEGILYSEDGDILLNAKEHVLRKGEGQMYFDTSLLKIFRITPKLINKWSFAIFSENCSMYILCRKDSCFLFKL